MRFRSKVSWQTQRPQLRHFAKDHLSFVLPSEMPLHASRGCQVDDLKKALRFELAHMWAVYSNSATPLISPVSPC